jgi:two-component sensor histidine kinase
MDIEIILVVSLAIQFIGAARSLFLIRVTGLKYAWVFLSLAFIFMGLRRVLSFLRVLGGEAALVDYENEVIGLVLSFCVLVGVFGLGPIFREWREARDQVKQLLTEKELLLKEVHHRIKNNMNTVASLLRLQSAGVVEASASAALRDAERRITSMSVLYDKIYRGERYEEIPSSEYLGALVNEIVDSFPEGGSIRVVREISEFRIGFRATYEIGIIVNELITNSMKYAFAGREAGTLRVSAEASSGRVDFTVQDDGVGFERSGDGADGFGLSLVESLVDNFGGKLRIESERGRGTTIRFSVPRSSLG